MLNSADVMEITTFKSGLTALTFIFVNEKLFQVFGNEFDDLSMTMSAHHRRFVWKTLYNNVSFTTDRNRVIWTICNKNVLLLVKKI